MSLIYWIENTKTDAELVLLKHLILSPNTTGPQSWDLQKENRGVMNSKKSWRPGQKYVSSFVFVTFVLKIIKPFKFSTYIVPLFESWRKNQKKLITIFHYWALYYLRWKDGIQLELLNFNASKVKRRNLVKKTVYMWC